MLAGTMNNLPSDAPAPRLCHLVKWPDFDGYGFNLHGEKTKPGQYIGKVDKDSPAELAGLKANDRIIEVNDTNISNENVGREGKEKEGKVGSNFVLFICPCAAQTGCPEDQSHSKRDKAPRD